MFVEFLMPSRLSMDNVLWPMLVFGNMARA